MADLLFRLRVDRSALDSAVARLNAACGAKKHRMSNQSVEFLRRHHAGEQVAFTMREQSGRDEAGNTTLTLIYEPTEAFLRFLEDVETGDV